MKTRRKFVQESIGISAASLLASRVTTNAASYSQTLGANDRIRVGLIGCGGQGRGDLRNFLRVKGVECVSLCDVDDSQSAQALQEVGEQTGQKPMVAGRDFRRLLDQKDIDAVIIGTPDHWHALTTIMACQAGKDVYVEKPLSISIGEGRAMVNVARQHNRVVQMGTQQRSGPHFREAVEYVKSGQLGKIRMVRCWAYQDWMGNIAPVPDSEPPAGVDYDMWLGPARKRPFNKNRFHFNFRWYWDYSGGLMTDWGAHMIDIANWGMGVKAPLSASSVGGKYGFPNDAEETPDTQQALWDCGGYSMIWEHATAVGQGPFRRDHGVEFHGNDGILVVDRSGWEVFPETDGKNKKVYRSAGVPHRGVGRTDMGLLHAQNFLECMRTRQRPHSDVEIGHNSMIALHLANIAFRVGRSVRWDVENEKIIGDAEAQKLVTREYRAPWRLLA